MLFAGVALLAVAAAHGAAKKPNVILIMTDDQGFGDMHCNGNPYLETPNTDKLYNEGVRLTNFHVDPTSSPTRSSLMTGRYSSRTGVWHTLQGRSIMDAEEITMAQIFRENGYRTGIFGKWHLGDSYPYHPMYRGFDECVTYGGGGVGQNPDYWRNDYFSDMYMHNGMMKHYEGYCTDVWFSEAMRFIAENQEKPFFCYIPTNAPHFPYFVAERYAAPYRRVGMSDQRARFSGMITNIDENLGKLRDKLYQLGIEENTILIFMSDNGSGFMTRDDFFYNAGMRGGKGSVYEGGHRVAFFIHYKDGKLTGGRDVNQLAAHFDLLPTLSAICGLEINHKIDLDGIDISAQLQGKANAIPRTLFVHQQRVDIPVKYKNYCVMDALWRLVGNGDKCELYNLAADPGQQNDLAKSESARLKAMREAYEKWWEHISGRFGNYSEIYLGALEEPVSWLTCHDWHSDAQLRTWDQDVIRAKEHGNGYWTVKVVRSGVYTFTLRTYPYEEDTCMGVDRVKMAIGDENWEATCFPGASQVTLTANLKVGSYRMQTWMYEPKGKEYGAPYVYVQY